MPSNILGKIELDNNHELEGEIRYLNGIPKNNEEYDEFGQGYWKNLSLYNGTGDYEDTQYKDSSVCLPTCYMSHCPQIEALIRHNFDFKYLKMVRARNLIDGMVIPHRDFVEFKDSGGHYRIFLAIEENLDSFHSDENGVFQMQKGEIWFLDAAIDHAAINFATKSRMFLCLDFILDKNQDKSVIFNSKSNIDFTATPTYIEREPIKNTSLDNMIQRTSLLINRRNFKDHLFALSKLHFTHEVGVRDVYDWLILATQNNDDIKLQDKARNLKKYLVEERKLSERFTINEWA